MHIFGREALPTLLIAVTVAAGSAAIAPTVAAERVRPALWTIEDEDTTITLFGTMHVMRPDVEWFHGEVRRAFDAADEVVLETRSLEAAEEQALVMRFGIDASGRGLRTKLGEAERTRYERALDAMGLPADALDPFEPWMAAVTLVIMPMVQAGYDPELGVDEVLSGAAERAGKTLTGLESPAEQLGFLDALDETLQLQMLNATVEELDGVPDDIGRMEALWSDGRIEELGAMIKALMTGYADDGRLEKVLLTDRNRTWADWVEDRMTRPGDVFLAVGAAHLAGGDSLIELLEARGHEIERVRPEAEAVD